MLSDLQATTSSCSSRQWTTTRTAILCSILLFGSCHMLVQTSCLKWLWIVINADERRSAHKPSSRQSFSAEQSISRSASTRVFDRGSCSLRNISRIFSWLYRNIPEVAYSTCGEATKPSRSVPSAPSDIAFQQAQFCTFASDRLGRRCFNLFLNLGSRYHKFPISPVELCI
jgi:hypothetical protein